MPLRQLRWAACIIPAGLLYACLLAFHLIDPAIAHSLEGAVAAGVVLSVGAYAVSTWTFRVVMKSEARLLTTQAQIRALNQAALDISAELDLQVLLQKVADAARQLLQAEYCALQVMPESGYPPSLVTSGMDPHILSRMGHPPRGRGVLGLVLREARPVRVAEIGKHPESVGFPANHPHMSSFLGVPIISRGKVVGQLYLSNKQTAAEFTREDEEVAEMLANQAAIAIENSWLYEQARRTNAHLQSLIAASHDAIVVMCGSGKVRLWNRGAEAMYGIPAGEAEGQILPMVPCDSHEAVLRTLQGVLRGRAVSTSEALHQHQDGSYVPVLFTMSPIEQEHAQDPCVVMIAKDMTERKLVEAQQHRLALLEERQRISMDLHDGAIQSLYAVGLGLGTTRMLLPRDPDQARERIGHSLEHVNDVIRQLREYIVNLRAEPARTLRHNLRQVADRLEADGRITVSLNVSGDVENLPGELANHLLHLAGEAASNVLRHSKASEVLIGLEVGAGEAVLRVRDNGQGFSPAVTEKSSGFGLRNMMKRAEFLGGTCRITSAEGQGAEVLVRAPIARKEETA